MNNSTTTYNIDVIKETVAELKKLGILNDFWKSVFGQISQQVNEDGEIYMTEKQYLMAQNAILKEENKRKDGEAFLNGLM